MAFDKAKVLKAAEKFLSQGKINAAIKEYRQIVDNDADDLTTLNMLGDLYVRASKKDEAIAITSEEVYERFMKYLTGCADLFRNGYTDVCQFTCEKG